MRIGLLFFCALAVIVALATGGEAAAPASPCRPYAKPITVDFTLQAPKPIFNNALNVAGIRNLFATRGVDLSGPHRRALGITFAKTLLSMNASSVIRPAGRTGYCVYLEKVEAVFGWDRMEVFVASEFKSSGCAYNAVLDHENQHVSINQSTLREFAPQLRARLERTLSEQQPLLVADGDKGADAALNAVYQRITPALDEFQQALAARNSAIDTDANYDATAALCPDWGNVAKQP